MTATARRLRRAAARIRRGRPSGQLTPREWETVRLIAEQGLTNQKIAAQLGVAKRTAESHLEHIYAKLQVHNRAQVVAWYFQTRRP